MSSPPPSSSHPPPPHTYPSPQASSSVLLPHTAGAPALGVLESSGAIAPSTLAPSALVLTQEQMTAAILELQQAVAGIRAFLVGPYAPQLHPQHPPPPPPHQQQLPPPPPPLDATMVPVISYQYGMPYDGTATTSFPSAPPPSQGVPIQQIKFPPSPSPLPAWIATRHVSAAVRLQAVA
nr:formin-like protein 5 [Aegilops tauschii subsp. strangulata]